MQNLRASFAAYWESIQQGLFPRLEQVLGSLTEKQQQLVQTLEVIRIEQMIPSRLRMLGIPEEVEHGIRRKWNIDSGGSGTANPGSGTRNPEEVEHRFRRKWNSGSGGRERSSVA